MKDKNKAIGVYEEHIKNDSNAKIPEGITPDFVELIETEILGMKPKNER